MRVNFSRGWKPTPLRDLSEVGHLINNKQHKTNRKHFNGFFKTIIAKQVTKLYVLHLQRMETPVRKIIMS